MTQCQAKIKGPYVNRLTRVIVDDGGVWHIRISVTLRATHAGMEIYPTVIGLQASVGGSAATSDWLCVLGPADGPPGGIWMGFIRRTVEHGPGHWNFLRYQAAETQIVSTDLRHVVIVVIQPGVCRCCVRLTV